MRGNVTLRNSTSPLTVPKTVRRDEWRGLTSVRAGVVNPIAFFPLLREDRIRGRIMVQVKMAEALHTIINPIRVSVHAYLIPKTALTRFDGSMETLNRAYKGEPMPGGGASPAWFVDDAAVAGAGSDDLGLPIYDVLGVHYKTPGKLNTDLVESYNRVINWRREAVSDALPVRADNDHTLAEAFWDNPKFQHIKPSFDAALMEGAIPVAVSGGTTVQWGNTSGGTTPGLDTSGAITMRATPAQDGKVSAYGIDGDGTTANLRSFVDGATISLANIELARRTQAFAQMRERYAALSDEYLVDLLMQGIRVPPEDFREPVLLGSGEAMIGQMERYATDGASLDVSVTNGVAQLSLTINTPAVNPSGMVLVTCEIVPEQLYERINDNALDYLDGTADWLPNFLQDTLDPQKVDTVYNRFADMFHTVPTGVFGYAPLNHGWQRSFARIGGRYKRPHPDTFKEDRARIWAVEKTDPSLSEDFYLCPAPFPHYPFADNAADPFEIITVGMMEIVGNTVFGGRFEEDSNSYEAVLAEVDQSRIVGTPVSQLAVEAASDGVLEE